MARQNITTTHPLNWEKVQGEFDKINENFVELYSGGALDAISGPIIPDTDIAYDLGSATYRFRDLYLSGSTIKLGDAVISATPGGGITVPGGITSTVTTSGITYVEEFLDTGGGDISWFFNDDPGNDFTPTVTIPTGWGTADIVQVYLAYSRITTNEVLFNRDLNPGEYTISGNSLTINVGVPNVNVVGSFGIISRNQYFLNDAWTPATSDIGPFTDGAEIPANGYDLTTPHIARPVWDIQLDGSNFLSSITLLDGGKNYLSYGLSTDNLMISASYAPSTVINFDSPVLYVDLNNPRIIASTSSNPGQFATPGPFTASWTDGTRSVSIDYEVITYFSNGLTLEYLRLVSDSSYSITGTFTGSDLVSDGAYLQRPELNFVIDPSNPTVLLPVVDWGTLTDFAVILIRFPVTGHISGVLPLGGVIGEITVTTTSGVSSKLIAPTHSYGEFGDKAGMIAWDGTYLYYCTADYVDDLTDVWIRVAATDTSW
jgi:hypothetical protein